VAGHEILLVAAADTAKKIRVIGGIGEKFPIDAGIVEA
jgi:phage shock protein PspC (stress-responsive transcriptional regulator)